MRSRNNKLINFILEISQVLLVFLGVYSAVMCTATSLVLSYSRGVCALVMLLAAVLFYGLFTVLETFHNGKVYGILGITVFFAMIIFYFRQQFQKGAVVMVNGFLKEFMNYTGSKLTLLTYNVEQEKASVSFCTTFVLILIGVYLTVIISAYFYRRRRSGVFIAVTLPFVFLPLVVGRLGFFSNLFTYLIVAMTVFGTRHQKTDATDRRMRQKLSLLLMLIGLIAGGISYICMPPSRYEDRKADITETKNSMVALVSWSAEDIFAWVKAHFNDDAIDYGTIGEKQEVDYTGEIMLKLSGMVNNNHGLYLKGYVGDHYEDNQWTSLGADSDYESDLSALTNLGLAPDGWHARIYASLDDNEKDGKSIWAKGTLRIRNLAFGYGNYVVPYLPTVSFALKENGRAAIETGGIDYTVEYFLSSPYVMRRDLLEGGYTILDNDYWSRTSADRDRISRFVHKYYLQVPDTLDEICGEFRQYLTEKGILSDSDKNTLPGKRAREAFHAVKTYIMQDTEYTLNPGRTPSDRETVEYFLKENKKGYCTYYATTAAILLRSVGIPTRYVEGMYVSPEELTEGTENNAEILVPDSDAHAWIEVFDDHYGFVPLEVTPGAGEDMTGRQQNNSNSNSQQDSKTDEPDSMDDTIEEPELVTPTPVPTQVPQEDMTFDDIEREKQPDGGAGLGTGDESSSGVWRIVIEVVIVLILIVAVLEAERRIRRYLFTKSLQKLRMKRRIRMVHRHLMPLFNARGAGYRGQPLAVYASVIAEAMQMPLDQITEYVSLVYHARFGPDDITEVQIAGFRMQYDKIRRKAYDDAKIIKKLYYMYIMVL